MLGAIVWFHLVSLHAALALFGVGSIVESQLASPDNSLGLAGALVLATLGVIAAVTISYVLNAALTWPVGGDDRRLRPPGHRSP